MSICILILLAVSTGFEPPAPASRAAYNRFAAAYNEFVAAQDKGVVDLNALRKMRSAWRVLAKSADFTMSGVDGELADIEQEAKKRKQKGCPAK